MGPDFCEQIWFDILSRLPAKAALRFRCVCKRWKKWIESDFFIRAHLKHASSDYAKLMLQHSEAEYVRFVPNQLPRFNKFNGPNIEKSQGHLAGATQGVLCHSNWNEMLVWNPTVKRCFTLISPDLYLFPVEEDITYTGIGFDESTETLKVVKFCVLDLEQAAVFSFDTLNWKKVKGLPDVDLAPFPDVTQLLVRQVAYWLAYALDEENSAPNPNKEKALGYSQPTILAFDFVAEKFNSINFPFEAEPYNLQMSQWQDEFLAVLHYKDTDHGRACDVWVIEGDGFWAKQFCFSFIEDLPPKAFWVMDEGARVLATTQFGTLELLLTKTNTHQPLALNPSWYHSVFDDGVHLHHFVHHFVESLLLLDQGVPLHLPN